MRILKKVVITLTIFALAIISIATIVKANETEKLEPVEISEQYKNWEKLSDEEKQKTIQPSIYDLKFIDSIKRSSYNAMLDDESELEKEYNLKNKIDINVKNQRNVGSCWAFTLSSVLETTMVNKYNSSKVMYSPMHIDYKTSEIFERKVGSGGTIEIGMSYLASGYGPVNETDFPFDSVYNEEKNPASDSYLTDIKQVDLNKTAQVRATDMTLFASIYKSYSANETIYKDSSSLSTFNKYSPDKVRAMRNLVKKHIKEDGAVFTYLYAGNNNTEFYSYFNNSTKAYYSNTLNSLNHAVTIVGWDDNFSKTNFKEGNQPLNDGAYIVLNSWGSEFGDNGYFYVSYDDAVIEQRICGVDKINTTEEKYDEIYEFDQLGMNVPMNLINEQKTAYLSSAYLANVFTRKDSSKIEYLTEVGLFMPVSEGVEIYVNSSSDSLTDGQLVATCTGTNALETGYHTVKLSSPVKLTGEKFSVKVKYMYSSGASLPLECDLIASGLSNTYNLYNTATSNAGESYVSANGTTWSDLYGYKVGDYTLKDTNACIKAFTSYSTNEQPETIAVTGVKLDKNSQTIKIGETATLTATVEPANATNKNVSWSSQDATIASVENGIVTGKKEGKVTITVTTEDGAYKATCEVTVEKQEVEQKVSVTGITLNKETEKVKVGETVTLVATVLPSNATNKNVTWSSSDESIASVKNGVVTAIKKGETTITATTEDGSYKATCKINVEENTVSVTGVTLDKQNARIQVGESMNLVATVMPLNATNKQVTWSSSNESVATISNTGIIKALKEGLTTITVKTLDGAFSAKCTLTVIAKTNNDDDVYKDTQKDDTTTIQPKIDNTKASTILPNTGVKTLFIIIAIISFILMVCFIKYRKLKQYIK